MRIECPREQDLLDALASSRWPERCEPGLRAHVDDCAICRDTIAVALPLLLEGDIAYAAAQVPSSGVVWWRAQVRARREAERAANRPIAIVQAFAFACGAALAGSMAYWFNPALPHWRDWLRHLTGAVSGAATSITTAPTLSPSSLLPWLMLAVCVVLVPIAIYLAVADDDVT